MDWDFHTVIIPLALMVDFILGDPLFLPHPIRWMGSAIIYLEPRFRRLPLPLSLSGLFFAISLIGFTYVSLFFFLKLCHHIHPALSMAMETVMIWYALSMTSLQKAALLVWKHLMRGDILMARYTLSLIVGRDVDELSEKKITRATIETIAENFVDGILSPIFFAGLGGGALALTYKMVNTLDSMVGYRDETYEKFGKASARIDDGANFIPAKLSIFIISLSAQLLNQNGKKAFLTALHEGKNHKSPNAGYPEASFAGGLQISLGGPSIYKEQLVNKPYIGKHFSAPAPKDILKACDLMVLSTLILTLAIVMVKIVT